MRAQQAAFARRRRHCCVGADVRQQRSLLRVERDAAVRAGARKPEQHVAPRLARRGDSKALLFHARIERHGGEDHHRKDEARDKRGDDVPAKKKNNMSKQNNRANKENNKREKSARCEREGERGK